MRERRRLSLPGVSVSSRFCQLLFSVQLQDPRKHCQHLMEFTHGPAKGKKKPEMFAGAGQKLNSSAPKGGHLLGSGQEAPPKAVAPKPRDPKKAAAAAAAARSGCGGGGSGSGRGGGEQRAKEPPQPPAKRAKRVSVEVVDLTGDD